MRPSTFVQTVLAGSVGCRVFSQVPAKVPGEFVLHTVTSNTAVSNGPVTESMDTTVAFNVVAESNDRAWEIANNVTQVLSEAYETGQAVEGTGLALFEATMLPVKQPYVDAVTAPGQHEYDSVFRMIFV